ncbi:Carrier protein, mitochondrial [Rhodosporidiobolus nylandii]
MCRGNGRAGGQAGAFLTPFDVIKTRLQTAPSTSSSPSPFAAPPTQPPPSHLPSTSPFAQAHVHPSHTPFPPPVASTSSAAAPALTRAVLPAAGAHCSVSSSGGAAALSLPYSAPSPSASTYFIRTPSLPPSHRRPPAARQPGFFAMLGSIVRHEGPSALWRGTAPALAMSVPGQVVYMLGYDLGRRTAFQHPPGWAVKDSGGGTTALYTTVVPLTAGAASRTVVAALLSPFELLRTQLQAAPTSGGAGSRGLLQLLSDLRWRTAWRGLGPTLWRDVPFSGVYWAGYEGIKRGLTGGAGMGERGAAVGEKKGLAGRLGVGEFGVAFVSGAGSGMIAATLTNPFDVIKTRRQALSAPSPSPSSSSSLATAGTRPPSTKTLDLLREITREEGLKGWFRGLTPRLAKVGPACGLMIGCYEALSSFSSARRASKAAAAGNAE